MKIGIVGVGFVGEALAQLLMPVHAVVPVDPGKGYNGEELLTACDAIFVCVPTPPGDTGACDTSIVEEVVESLPVGIPIAIRSTVPPGTCRMLAHRHGRVICHTPEFIVERGPDAASGGGFVVVGGPAGSETDLFMQIFSSCLPSATPIAVCTTVEAETMKYAINTFLATKVTFFNQLMDACDLMDVSFGRVRELVALDWRVGPSHTMVFRDQRGFGGKCLPKDSEAWVSEIEGRGGNASLVQAAIAANVVYRYKR